MSIEHISAHLSEDERRSLALDALHSGKLEGLSPSTFLIHELENWISGTSSIDELISRVKSHHNASL
ncbi:hypothetical protein J2S49_000425 [Arcanobacterium wilhelmae]|uniref:Antitoxin VbhA domain-containing protein n=1 Tax=Arcanobacterium wilhelmae TaxID=1803177 RepID=A0ABT9N9G3_9ACTO|nr:antitoxin VbhA family protein [Arcanobacterium wilhelmae]MDP9800349.1 hypothetical protein [Arcanobacterium wilhelmae]WFN89785.1 antitoxin VbhA family protein [Arcanobacterium wilhelmae]